MSGRTTAASSRAGPGAYSPRQRMWASVFLMSGAIMNMIDTTIANVALPQMQGTTSSTREEITWVLTSYVIATAIATPLVGWLAGRLSRKVVLLGSVAGFTLFSALCGISTTVEELVLFRICQGITGAGLVPLAQTAMLDIYPREEHGKAMSILQLAGVAGPLVGPMLGGWLTSNFSWGWVFLVNVPIGTVAFLGLAAMLRDGGATSNDPFDGVSFGLLAVAIGSFQLMLDRGAMQDWFDSPEIVIEAIAAAAGLIGFLFVSAGRRKPFFPAGLLADRNYVLASVVAFLGSGISMSVMAILPDMLAQLYGYPAQQIGYVMAPRGAATILVTPFMPWLMRKVELRLLMAAGIVLISLSTWQLSWLTLDADSSLLVLSGMVQGAATSVLWTPLTMLAYSTVPANLRDEAAGLHMLMRFLGMAIGISLLQTVVSHAAAASHSNLAGVVQLQYLPQALRDAAGNGGLAPVLSAVNGEVTRQAGMVGFLNGFWIILALNTALLPLVLMFRFPRPAAPTKRAPASDAERKAA